MNKKTVHPRTVFSLGGRLCYLNRQKTWLMVSVKNDLEMPRPTLVGTVLKVLIVENIFEALVVTVRGVVLVGNSVLVVVIVAFGQNQLIGRNGANDSRTVVECELRIGVEGFQSLDHVRDTIVLHVFSSLCISTVACYSVT